VSWEVHELEPCLGSKGERSLTYDHKAKWSYEYRGPIRNKDAVVVNGPPPEGGPDVAAANGSRNSFGS